LNYVVKLLINLRRVITSLPALIHAISLAGCSCPEQKHTTNPKCILIVNHLWREWSWQK